MHCILIISTPVPHCNSPQTPSQHPPPNSMSFYLSLFKKYILLSTISTAHMHKDEVMSIHGQSTNGHTSKEKLLPLS